MNQVSLYNVMTDIFHKFNVVFETLLHGLNSLKEVFPMQFGPNVRNSIGSIIASLFGGIADTFIEVVLRSMPLNPCKSDRLGPFGF